MKRIILLFTAILLCFSALAQNERSIIIDQHSFRAVQTDALTGVNIDPIGLDSSRRPCSRIKVKINRMSPEDIDRLSVKIITNNQLTKCRTAGYDNGLIIEMTAKAESRFYFNHPEFGESNEVVLNLEPNKEYYMEASLNQTYSIVVSSNVEGANVYLDGLFKGCTDENLRCTIANVMTGEHKLRVSYGDSSFEQSVAVNKSSILFRLNLNVDVERYDVNFKVVPSDATIVVDGMEQRVTGGKLSLRLGKGRHSYTVQAEQYHPQSGEIVVGGSDCECNISLLPAFGWLEVAEESLNGAEIWINDKSIGRAPIKSDRLASGVYRVRVVKDMYKPFEASVTILDNQIVRYTPDLKADFSTVTLLASSGVEIWVNGEKMGEDAWTGRLVTGKYTFEARKAGYRSGVITKQITPDLSEQSYLLPAPTPIYGTITVETTPSAVTVAIDGKQVGNTPLTLSEVLVGNHTLTLSKTSYNNLQRDITVVEGEHLTINLALTNVPTNKIYYTTSDGYVLEPRRYMYISSNVYEDGRGVITFVDDITKIGYDAFKFCHTLTSITIPNSVTEIDQNAFYNCNRLESIAIPYGVTKIGRDAFCRCFALTSATIPDSVTDLGVFMFYECAKLKSVRLSNSIEEIGFGTFNGCTSLETITIPESVKTIAGSAFKNCSSLTTITIPEGVTSIGDAAFCDCSSLMSIYCNSTTPPTLGGKDVFKGNAKGRKIYVPASAVEAYKSAKYWSAGAIVAQ